MSDASNTQGIAARSGRWFKRLGLTLMTAAVLTGIYSTYSMVLRPVVELPGPRRGPITSDNVPPPPPPPEGVRMAERYLATQPWAANAKYVLRTAEAYVYFEEWDPRDGDEAIEFTPFAMIWLQKGRKPDEPPITIISDSAYVRFAQKFKITDPSPGRVIGGSLNGAVQIDGPNAMQVVGQDFVFSEQAMRIWCDNHVDFTYGPHKGNGHGLQIELIPDEVARAQEKLAVKGFKSVKLRRNVSMDLEFRDGQALAAGSETPPPDSAEETKETNEPKEPKEPKKPTLVKVRSAGSFEFVVAANVATFEDEVRIYQPTEPGKYNSLQSDYVTLYFEPKEKENVPPRPVPVVATVSHESAASPGATDASGEKFQSVNSNLTFRRLVAWGQNVILRSETNDLIAMMHHLDYDAKTRLAKLTSRETVRVLQKQSEMHAPTIELLHLARGQVSHVWARGAGWLKSLDEKTGQLAFAAQWKKELRKLPDPRTGLDVIELDTEALVRQPEDQFGLAADFIRLWLDRAPEQNSNPAFEQKTDQETGRSNSMRPKKLLALKNVAIVSPDLQGQSKRLEVWFEPAPAGAMPEVSTTQTKRSRSELLPAIQQVPAGQAGGVSLPVPSSPPGSPPIFAVSRSSGAGANPLPLAPPAADPPSSDSKTAEKPTDPSADQNAKPETLPIEVVADLIRVKVLTFADQRESQVSEVWTEGHVTVKQDHGPDALPLQMTGERLHVRNRAKNDQVMTLWGSPAHVRDRGMHIEGREIFLDREKNDSKVNGAGLLQLPVKRSLDGEVLAEPKLLDIWWTETMTFNGLNAKFFGNVRAVMNNDGLRSNVRCEEMEVVLSERISFSQDRSLAAGEDRAKTEIARVYCKDGVEFDSYKYEESKLCEVRRGRFAEFALNQTTGDTTAQGPGWIKMWRRGRGKRASLSPNASVKANRALKPDPADWEYVRIDFAGTSDGNVKQKFNTFKENVEIVYGPVERSLMTIEVENLPKDAGWMRCENLRMTQHDSPEKDGTGHVDLLATGNAELEGRTFHARADSISYDESKGLYVLRSQGRQKATIWRETQLGGELSRADAQLMNFIPARNILKLDQAVGLDGVN